MPKSDSFTFSKLEQDSTHVSGKGSALTDHVLVPVIQKTPDVHVSVAKQPISDHCLLLAAVQKRREKKKKPKNTPNQIRGLSKFERVFIYQ